MLKQNINSPSPEAECNLLRIHLDRLGLPIRIFGKETLRIKLLWTRVYFRVAKHQPMVLALVVSLEKTQESSPLVRENDCPFWQEIPLVYIVLSKPMGDPSGAD